MENKFSTLIHKAIFILLMGNTSIAWAAFHSLADIRNTAIDYARIQFDSPDSDIKVTARDLDNRLRLPLCESKLEAYFPHSTHIAGNTTVGVRCSGIKPWSIYVPVTIQLYRDIIVANRPLPQNRIITMEDFRMEHIDINRLSGAYITEPDLVIGKQMLRPLQLSRPILSNMLKAPVLIRRGERVILLAKSNTFEVRMEGKAMKDGAVGEKIRVRNLRSKRIIEGRVNKDGSIHVY
ncbi:MAG: flagellar basal body P-ring formation chaperone FlgA [Gammaproteobacteria bacterium]|nr:flagellar basal body P-ring formation chaperone FlgA [Gammaproteobacteria bacterium]